jgi:hypothetical protein
VSNDIEIHVSTRITTRRVDRPARCRAVPRRTPRSVKPFARLCLDAPRRSQTLTRHLSPAVPPSLGVAHPAGGWPLDLFAGTPRAWYRHPEPLLVTRLGSPPKDCRPAGREALSITQQQAGANARPAFPGPSSGAPRYARRPSPTPRGTPRPRWSSLQGRSTVPASRAAPPSRPTVRSRATRCPVLRSNPSALPRNDPRKSDPATWRAPGALERRSEQRRHEGRAFGPERDGALLGASWAGPQPPAAVAAPACFLRGSLLESASGSCLPSGEASDLSH